jgi:hypothetical protein
MMQPERPSYRKKRRVFPKGQQYRVLDPACRLALSVNAKCQPSLNHAVSVSGMVRPSALAVLSCASFRGCATRAHLTSSRMTGFFTGRS